jgi:uncharacterized protein (TIGR02266 family)
MRSSEAVQPEQVVDRRRHERVDAQLMVRVAEHHPVDKRMRGYLERVADNVSLGGLFIRTKRPCAKGTSLRLDLRLSSDISSAPSVRANAIVRWTRRWGGSAGMGVEFLDFDMKGRDDLDRFLKLIEEHPQVQRPSSRPVR